MTALEELKDLVGAWVPEAFPLFYQGDAQFMTDDGDPSGARGAMAEIDVPINNYPHILYAIRICNTYELTDEDGFLPTNFLPRDRPGLALWDEEQKIRVDFAQQNIITKPILQPLVTGRQGIHWHMLPSPYLLRGANRVRVELTRVQPYPILGTEQAPFPIAPTAEVGLVTASLVSDLFPGGPPGSTGRPQAGAS